MAAHPDDVDFGAAGTVASWTKAGIEVAYCICTSGGASVAGGLGRDEVTARREAEQLVAAGEVGVSDVTFLRYPDGELQATLQLRKDITRVIRTVRPDRVLAWSPEYNWAHLVTSHPDHRASGEATVAAVYPDAGNPLAHPSLLEDEHLEPWNVREIWLTDSPDGLPNHAVDVTATFENKLAALRAHKSQTAQATGLEAQLREHFTAVAQRHNLPEGHLAEEFQIVRTS